VSVISTVNVIVAIVMSPLRQGYFARWLCYEVA
jgi:hypothetical protein